MSLTFYTSFARAQNAHVLSVGRTKKRERETERRSCLCLLGVVVVVRRKRSIIFDRKKKKCNKFLCAIGILAVGKTYLSDLSIDCVYYTFETEKTECRERRGRRTGI